MAKIWVKPKIIAVVRGKPEEAVLQFCKGNGGSSPNNFNANCLAKEVVNCSSCNNISAS